MDALVNEDEGKDLTDFFAHNLHGVSPATVMLLDVVVQEWVLQDSLRENTCCNPTDPIELVLSFDQARLWKHHANGKKEEADEQDFLAGPDLIHVADKDREEDGDSHGNDLDDQHLSIDVDGALLGSFMRVSFLSIYEPYHDR